MNKCTENTHDIIQSLVVLGTTMGAECNWINQMYFINTSFYNAMTQVNDFLMEDKSFLILYNKYRCCWCHGVAKRNISYVIVLIFPRYSGMINGFIYVGVCYLSPAVSSWLSFITITYPAGTRGVFLYDTFIR